MNKKFVLNEQIKDKFLIVIDQNGQKLGEMSKEEALTLAQNVDLDLVLFSSGDRPIAKIMDFGKFVYENKKKQKSNLKNQIKSKNKEIKVKPNIGLNDLEVRIRNAKKWLASGHRIQFVILTYGRIVTKTDLIFELYNLFIEKVGDSAIIQQPLKKVSNTQYVAFLIPNKK